MNRRQFTTRLAALFAAPALPAPALASAISAPAAAPVVAISTGATSWAAYLQAMHDTCTPAMLKSALNLSPDMAQTLHGRMVTDGIIQGENRVVKNIKTRLSQMMDNIETRAAVAADLDALTDIWHAGWHEAHGEHVPADLIALRDRDSLEIRMQNMLDDTDVVGPVGAPVGFCTISGDEIYQFYVAPSARGRGVADALMQAGEARLAAAGVETAQVFVLPQNPRAIAFYRRCGWRGDLVKEVALKTLGEDYMLPCLILTKQLS